MRFWLSRFKVFRAAEAAVPKPSTEIDSTPKTLTAQELWQIEADKLWDEFQAEKLRIFGSVWVDPDNIEYQKLYFSWWKATMDLEEKYFNENNELRNHWTK